MGRVYILPMGMQRTGIYRNCDKCGTEYYVPGWRMKGENYSKFCSMACVYEGRPPAKRKGLTLQCSHCSQDFYVAQGRAETAKFCSRSCHAYGSPEKQAKAAKAAGDAIRGTGFSEEEKKARKREADKRGYDKHKSERLKKNRERYQQNKEAHAEAGKAWRENNRERSNFISRVGKHRRRSAAGIYTCEDIDRIRDEQKGKCAFCRIKMQGSTGPARETIDHIVAVSKGGTNWPKNLQLLCKSCNSKKHDKDAIDFAREHGMLL